MFRILRIIALTLKKSVSSDFGEEFHTHYQKEWEETDWTKTYLA